MRIRKIYLITLLAVLCTALLQGCRKPEAGSGNLEGRVTYSTGEGIEGVAVIYGDSAVYTAIGGTYI